MKLVKAILVATLMGISSVASAGWVDVISEGFPGTKISSGDTVTRTHDIRDEGFKPIITPVFKADLSFRFSDDLLDPRANGTSDCVSIFCFEEEWARLGIVDTGLFSFNMNLGSFEVDFLDTRTYSFNLTDGAAAIALLADIWWDGQLKYSIRSTAGDFYFLGSRLAVNVPEPGSLALLGLGLTSLVLVRRRRQQKR